MVSPARTITGAAPRTAIGRSWVSLDRLRKARLVLAR